jgi:predicted metal-dependent HD superfamily phosphohydrolase
MLAIAALFHDTGFTIQYDDNEPIGAKIAHNYLKTILYPIEKIKIVEQLILATSPKVEPKNKLEEIIKDADLDNLGRDDFFEVAERVKKELETIKKIKIKDPDWHHAALDVIGKNGFYTHTQNTERGEKRRENEEKLRTLGA